MVSVSATPSLICPHLATRSPAFLGCDWDKHFCGPPRLPRAFQVVLVSKNLAPNAGDIRDLGSIPGWGRSPGGENGNAFQYSCLEDPMGRGAWRAFFGVAKSPTRLKRFSTMQTQNSPPVHHPTFDFSVFSIIWGLVYILSSDR